jgi:formylglycine-generating enzyme
MLVACLGLAELAAPAKMILVPAGVHTVGHERLLESPVRKVKLRAFKIAAYETTNAEFKKFIDSTGFVTDAERLHNGMTFTPPLDEFEWLKDTTASWKFPNGKKNGGIETKMDHPVTGISYRDAQAYCRWAGVRLPTVDEWEVATRAGTRSDQFYAGGLEEIRNYGNVWHRRDHLEADRTDGFVTTSPVGSFRPNAWGLYDVYGNVFEFCSGTAPGRKKANRKMNFAHARGGSWWCSKWTCCSFNSFDMGEANIYASFSNQGFRVVQDVMARKLK